MDMPANRFKRALAERRQQIGLWCSLPGSYAAEAVAGSGYDWLLFDTEHSPGDPLTVLAQLQAVAPYDVSAVVRPASNDAVLIKRFLDLGAQTLLIPYVQNAQEARAAVAATRYPPDGIRGVSGLTRATRFGRIPHYGRRAADELCLLVQVETADALDAIPEIAAVEGVDGIFIGPADLAASLGHVGEPGHPRWSPRSKTRSAASAPRASPPVSSPPTRPSPNAASRSAPSSPPSPSTPGSWQGEAKPSRRSSRPLAVDGLSARRGCPRRRGEPLP